MKTRAYRVTHGESRLFRGHTAPLEKSVHQRRRQKRWVSAHNPLSFVFAAEATGRSAVGPLRLSSEIGREKFGLAHGIPNSQFLSRCQLQRLLPKRSPSHAAILAVVLGG